MRRIGYELVSNMRRAFPEVVGHEMRDEDAGCMREANLWNPMPPYGVAPEEAWTPPCPRPLYGVAGMEEVFSSRPIMRGETFWRERVFEPVHELRGWTVHSALFDTGDVRTIALYCKGDAATFVLTETVVAFPDVDVQDLPYMRETSYTYRVALSAVFMPRCAALYSLIDEGHTTTRSWRMLWESFAAIVDVVREAPCVRRTRSGARVVYGQPVEFGCPAEAARFDGSRWTALVRAFEPLAVEMHGVGPATVRVVDGALGEGRVGGAKQWFWALDAKRTLFVRGVNELNSRWMVGLIVMGG